MDILIPVAIFVPLGIALIIALTRIYAESERIWLMTLLIPAFLLRIGLAVTFEAFPPLRVFHEDSVGVELVGQILASHWRGEGPPFRLPESNWGYHFLA